MGITAVGLLGNDGGPALPLCDLAIVVPDKDTARIQECHITLGHAILVLTEDRLVR
jgi:D-sedoheptulose 7-phosphate isomerase